MTHQPKPAPSPGTRRALVHNAITKALSEAGDRVPLSVRIAATRAALAEVDAWHAAEPAACAHCGSSDHTWDDCEAYTRLVAEDATAAPAAVSAAVAPPTNQTAVLREAADAIEKAADEHPDQYVPQGLYDAADRLRRMADETATETQAAVDLPTLAAALDGLHTLIATSSRDWGTYRVDAWLWAVLCGWDCEDDHEHDELCEDGEAMKEMAARHGWDEATVAKARRYRAAVRAVTEALHAAGARQDGAES